MRGWSNLTVERTSGISAGALHVIHDGESQDEQPLQNGTNNLPSCVRGWMNRNEFMIRVMVTNDIMVYESAGLTITLRWKVLLLIDSFYE